MGTQNKQRRAAKARARRENRQHRDQHRSSHGDAGTLFGGPPFGGPPFGGPPLGGRSADSQVRAEAVTLTVLTAARASAGGRGDAAYDCARELLSPPATWPRRLVLQAAGSTVMEVLASLADNGWEPVDVYQIVRRRLNAGHAELAVCLLAADAAVRGRARLDPRHTEQLAHLGAVPWSPTDEPVLATSAMRLGQDAVAVLALAIGLLGLWMTLPALTRLRPSGPVLDSAGVDERALARVRGLLAKAESTEFPEEAEALTAKAQELMARYSIGRLLAASNSGTREPTTARRLWVDAPYASPKALLIQCVAKANRCRGVWDSSMGFVTVIGDERDLVSTELLMTSLLVQASREMIDRGHRDSAAGARTRSFRQSFLAAYAARIGERLQRAARTVAQDLAGADRLPVLVRHDERVEQAAAEMFPGVVFRRISANHRGGWAAGVAAADAARLDTGQGTLAAPRAS